MGQRSWKITYLNEMQAMQKIYVSNKVGKIVQKKRGYNFIIVNLVTLAPKHYLAENTAAWFHSKVFLNEIP